MPYQLAESVDSELSIECAVRRIPTQRRAAYQDRYPDWESVYRDNVRRIYRMMFEKVGNRYDAEDLTEEVFLAAMRPLRMSVSVGEIRSYLLSVARTVLAAHWRHTLGRQVTTLDDETVLSAFVEQPTDGVTPRQVSAILTELPERYRRILELRFLASYTAKDAAAEMGITVGHAKVLQHRALRQAASVAERIQQTEWTAERSTAV